MVHHHGRRLHNRQDGLPETPTAPGLTAASVAQSGVAAGNSLVFNTAASNTNAAHDNVNFSASPTATVTPEASQTSLPDGADDPSSSPSSSVTPVGASGSDIPLGTVIGACLGALAGCVIIILVGLWLYKRGNKPRRRSPSNAHKGPADKERAWGKLEDDNEDKWEGKDGGKYQQKGVVSVGPMEKLTMFKKGTPSVRTAYTTTQDHQELPAIAHFDHPFAQYHPDLAKELAQDGADLPTPRPFLARVETGPPISWGGDTVGRDSFLSLSSNPAMSPGMDMAIPTPKLTSFEPHHWESAEVIQYDHGDAPRGRSTDVVEPEPEPAERPRKSSNNPFFGSRMSVHSTHSRASSFSSPSKSSLPEPDPLTMPAPPPPAFTREEKGKYRAVTPPSPTSSMAPSTITGHNSNPFTDPPSVFVPEHTPNHSHDRALQSLIAALGSTAEDVEARLRVASMNPSVVSESAYTETDGDEATLHQSWPVPPSRP